MDFSKETLLVIAPHADDEILGCFKLIKKIKEQGGKIFVLIISMDSYEKIGSDKFSVEQWKSEFLKTASFLDLDGFDFGYFNNSKMLRLDNLPFIDLVNIIESQTTVSLFKIKPTMIAIPTIFSTHQDHIVVYQSCMTALRIKPQHSHLVVPTVISYESPEYSSWSGFSEFGQFLPNFYLPMTQIDLDEKIAGLNLYQSQLRDGHRDKNSLTRLAKTRGAEIGSEFAESYHIHRLYIQ
jgi:N-acetylglucosamine malate deacetylase 1